MWETFGKGELRAENGKLCDVTYMYDTSLRMEPQYALGHCDSVLVGSQLFSLPIGWPVANKFAQTMNYWIKKLKDEKKWEELVDKYKPVPVCDFYTFDTSVDELAELGV